MTLEQFAKATAAKHGETHNTGKRFGLSLLASVALSAVTVPLLGRAVVTFPRGRGRTQIETIIINALLAPYALYSRERTALHLALDHMSDDEKDRLMVFAISDPVAYAKAAASFIKAS